MSLSQPRPFPGRPHLAAPASGLAAAAAAAVWIGLIAASIQAASAQVAPALIDSARHPEGESGRAAKPVVRAGALLAVTAHPLASDAAYAMLAAGGSAVDAAIAAQAVLTVVEPQSSGIGGGGFLVHFDPASRKVLSYDGRESAPADVDAGLFAHSDGAPFSFEQAVVGGRAVGVPGLMRMLELAHAEHGKLPWSVLFAPAIRHAREGFAVGDRLHTLLKRERFLKGDSDAAALYYPESGQPVASGRRLRNPQLADTLERLASEGASVMYEGPIAEAIVERVRSHRLNPGRLTLEDLRGYRAIRRTALCAPFRHWLVCGAPPPSAGAIAVAQILAILDALPASKATAENVSADYAHRFSEAVRLAFADRDRWVGDPDFSSVPVAALTAPDYLLLRAGLISERSLGVAPAGDPIGRLPRVGRYEAILETERESTTHLSIVDAAGRAVSMTSSIEDAFGSRLMVRGFLLNNQLTDFSWAAGQGAFADPNRVEPRKRPRSSMAPTLVFQPVRNASPAAALAAHADGNISADFQLMMVLGSPGGPAIISYVARTVHAVLAGGTALQQAVEAPNIASRNGPTEIESGPGAAALGGALSERGHRVRIGPMTSGLHGILRSCDSSGANCLLESGTDPRREGFARGH